MPAERMTQDELIEALEKAEGPSRELDAEISVLCGNESHRDTLSCYACGCAPRYTASLDAALTLVPEGWQWLVSNRAQLPHAGRAYLNNREPHFSGVGSAPNPKYRGVELTAATPTLALCSAALRARRTTGKEE